MGSSARQQFPDGVLIQGSRAEAIAATQQAIAAGATCLFEAAFEFDNLFIRCDILRQISAATWELIEVKSSSRIEDEHYWDVAVQKYVLTGAGLSIAHAKMMLVNSKTCYFPDLSNLFTLEDITPEVDRLLPEIPHKLEQFRATLAESEPTLAIGQHCKKPNACPFTDDCWQHVPDRSIFTIPRLDWKKKDALIAQSILAISDLPFDFALSPKQRRYVDSLHNNQATIDTAAIAASLAKLTCPIHFFDFEAQNPAIPRWNGLKPYEQFPFQYSCHVLHSNGTIEHREYLHTDSTDPRHPLLTALTADIAPTGSVIVYHQSFEATLLKKLAADFPEFALSLSSIVDRLWDLEQIFTQHYQHPDFLGRTSIKAVLPVLIPTLSYKALDVQRGDQAQQVWEMAIALPDNDQKQELMQALRAYCQLSTLR